MDLGNEVDPVEKRKVEERARRGDTFAKAIALYHEDVAGGNRPGRGSIGKRPVMGSLRVSLGRPVPWFGSRRETSSFAPGAIRDT